jgi:hypothetical protein
MARTPRYTQKQIEAALVSMSGNVSAAARSLGMQRYHLHKIIAKSEKLQQAVHDARQSMCDNAESALNRAVINGEAWAVCFTLKTQAKDRGYIERTQTEISGRDGGPIEQRTTVFDHSAAIASIASRSAANPGTPGTDEIRGNGEEMG